VLSCGNEVTMKKTAVLSVLVLLVATRLAAQSPPADSLFDRLIGHWVLRGTIARQSTTHDVTFDWMLGREYVQMHEVSRERAADSWQWHMDNDSAGVRRPFARVTLTRR
jgi:hypothetical protein